MNNNLPQIKYQDYQIYAKNFIKTHPYCGLFLDMGLGKTLTTLGALYEMNPSGNVLVIAPASIARSSWLDEIEKWGFPFRYQSFLVNERQKKIPKKKRHELYEQAVKDTKNGIYKIYFISCELVTDLVENCPWVFPNVVIDEAQTFKTYNSKRFRALKAVRPKISRLIELTGTPAPNGVMDIWALIYLLDQGQRLGKNITAYRNTYFNPGMMMNGYPVSWNPKPGAEDAIYDKIGDVVISMKNKLKLPPLTMNKINIYMSEKEKKKYDELKNTQVLKLNEDEEVTAVNAGVLSAKLSQMASGAIYRPDSENKEYIVIHKNKLEQTKYIIENTGSPVLIAYYFNSDKEMLMDYLEKEKLNPTLFDGSADMLHRWNNREIPVLLIQPASAGRGLNFQAGGHTLVWYTVPWSLELYQQCNARLYRQGQNEPVVIHHLLTKGTIDEKIMKAIENKDLTQSALMDAVKAQL